MCDCLTTCSEKAEQRAWEATTDKDKPLNVSIRKAGMGGHASQCVFLHFGWTGWRRGQLSTDLNFYLQEVLVRHERLGIPITRKDMQRFDDDWLNDELMNMAISGLLQVGAMRTLPIARWCTLIARLQIAWLLCTCCASSLSLLLHACRTGHSCTTPHLNPPTLRHSFLAPTSLPRSGR